jgi:hypothetical protein
LRGGAPFAGLGFEMTHETGKLTLDGVAASVAAARDALFPAAADHKRQMRLNNCGHEAMRQGVSCARRSILCTKGPGAQDDECRPAYARSRSSGPSGLPQLCGHQSGRLDLQTQGHCPALGYGTSLRDRLVMRLKIGPIDAASFMPFGQLIRPRRPARTAGAYRRTAKQPAFRAGATFDDDGRAKVAPAGGIADGAARSFVAGLRSGLLHKLSRARGATRLK